MNTREFKIPPSALAFHQTVNAKLNIELVLSTPYGPIRRGEYDRRHQRQIKMSNPLPQAAPLRCYVTAL